MVKHISNNRIIEIAKKHGFDLVGFSKVEKLKKEIKYLSDWISQGKNGGMKYLAENLDKREDATKILSDAKSVISLGMNYYTNFLHKDKNGFGKISRYAWGKDYHYEIWERLAKIESEIKIEYPDFQCKSYVDTGPVMDKVWAVKSGLGWMGKNTNVINRQIGSWFFIANIFSNIELEESIIEQDFCGTCTACIDACPTDALTPYKMDATKCISYLTIENKGEIDSSFNNKFDNWIFGCDICQDVCPWNKKNSTETKQPFFQPILGTSINLNEFEALSNRTFNQKFDKTPLQRARLKGMKRNANFLKKSESN